MINTRNASATLNGRKVTRLPKNGADPFYGLEVISTSVSKNLLIELEATLKKHSLNRAEFIRHAVVRELAFHRLCNIHSVNPTSYINVEEVADDTKLRQIAKILGKA